VTEDERIARLQRLAYGADVPQQDRDRAAAELAELAARGPAADRAGGAEATIGPVGAAPPTSSTPADADPDEPDARDLPDGEADAAKDGSFVPARLVPWMIALGGIGLVVGAVIGLGVGRQVPGDTAATSPVGASSSAEPGTPLDETDLLPLFDRLPQAAEAERVARIDTWIDPASVRLLASRTDGPAAYLARTIDGEDVCLVLLLPAGPSPSTCTVDGRLPMDGLRIRYDAEGYGFAVAGIDRLGTVQLGLIVSF